MTVFFAADGECALIVAACNNTQAVACADGAEIIAARRIFNGNIEFCFAVIILCADCFDISAERNNRALPNAIIFDIFGTLI